MIDEPFLRLSRAYFEHPFWKEDRAYSSAEAWLDLVRMAAWRTHPRLVTGKMIEVPRGGIVATERFLSDRWKWSRTKVRAYFDLLSSEHMAERIKTNGLSLLLLCNYERFNPSDGEIKTAGKPRENQEKTELEEGKERKNDPLGARPLVTLPTLDQAKEFAPSAGVDPRAAECWWLECESRPLSVSGHFTDRDGNPIAKWRSHLTVYGRKWQANELQRKRRSGSRPPAAAPTHDPHDTSL